MSTNPKVILAFHILIGVQSYSKKYTQTYLIKHSTHH